MPKAVNKVEYGGQTLIDLTGDTVTAGSLKKGVTAHDRSGASIIGTAMDKYIGLCEATLDTEASTSSTKAYTASISGVTALEEGMAVAVRFPNGVSCDYIDGYHNVTLNLNSLGAVDLMYRTETFPTSYVNNSNALHFLPAGYVGLFVYTTGYSEITGENVTRFELLNPEQVPYYGVCKTGGSTKAKTVYISGIRELFDGLTIRVKFNSSNTATSPTLNVNGLGAKAIYNGNAAVGKTAKTSWASLAIVTLTYYTNNSTGYWGISYYGNDTYTSQSLGNAHGTCDTAMSTLEKAVVSASYALATGGKISVAFTYDVPADSTLNVNSKGAKAIYYKGAAIGDGIIKAGDVALFVYDGTNYVLLSIDRVACEAPSTGGGGVPYGTCSASNGDFYKDVIIADFAGQTDIPYGTIFTVNFANGICGDEMLRINNGTQNMTVNGSSGSAYDGSIAFPLRNPPAKMTPNKQCLLEVVAAYDTENMQVALFVTGAKQAIAPVKYGVYNYGSVSFSGYSQDLDIWNTDLIIIRFDAAPTSGTWTGPWTGYYTSITAYRHGTAVASGDIESGDTCLFRPRRVGSTWRLDMLANDRLAC